MPLIKAQRPGAFDRLHRVRAIFNAPHHLAFEQRFSVRTLEAFAVTETSHLRYYPYPQCTLGSTGRAHEDWDIELVHDNDVHGCFADAVTLPAARAVHVPSQINLVDIAGFPLKHGTSYYDLVLRAQLAPGGVPAVHGTSSGVGLAAVKPGKMLDMLAQREVVGNCLLISERGRSQA